MMMNPLPCLAQQAEIFGLVRDAETGQALSPVTIYDKENQHGTITDESGRYRLRLPEGKRTLSYSFTGYQPIDTSIMLNRNLRLDILMKKQNVQVDEVTILGDRTGNQVHSNRMGSFSLSAREARSLPALMGESDPLKLLQLTPGVQGGSEGGVGYYVRGGGTDQNLILFDQNLVYNPGHLLGFFSLFNPEVVQHINIIKSGIPAEYGGKLSSVIQIYSNKGNPDSISFLGSVGLISSRATLSGPFAKKKGTFVLSGRKTYMGLLVEPLVEKLVSDQVFFIKNSNYDFYDFNAAGSYLLTPHDKLEFTAYYGRDKFSLNRSDLKQENGLHWGNSLASLKWNHRMKNQSEAVSSVSWTSYQFNLTGSQAQYSFGLNSSTNDVNLKTCYIMNKSWGSLVTGAELTDHRFVPNKIAAQAGEFVLHFPQFSVMHALEGGLFTDGQFKLTERLHLAAGMRFSFFSHTGPYQELVMNEAGQVIDTLRYAAGHPIATYWQPEPRLVLRFELNSHTSLKASYMHIAQYIHLATSAAVSLPTDIWISSTDHIKPMYGDQWSLGYYRELRENNYEVSAEIYYRKSNNQLEFLHGIINNSISGNIVDNITTGTGKAYGMEWYLRKKQGRTTGWISYTLARTELQFERINNGLFYPAKYDRRHDLSITLMQKLTAKWNASAVFVFASGNAYTLPAGRYIIQGQMINQYGPVNSYRMPPYHRLDVSVTRKIVWKGKWESELVFSVYNVYNRANPYYITYEIKGDLQKYSLKVVPVQISLFPVIPSISWNFFF